MKKINRRDFLKTTAMAAATVAASPLLASEENQQDYKAIVCVLLEGGADTLSMVVPKYMIDAHSKHQESKGEVTPNKEDLRILAGSRYGFHPEMSKMQYMFNYRELAVVANVGTLIHPVTKKEIETTKKSVELPKGLFSQVAQRESWMMAGNSDKGWAAKVSDLLSVEHTNVSVGGFNKMQHGSDYEAMMAFDDAQSKSLEEQLDKVATLIASREKMNLPKRQIFFVRDLGWDTNHQEMDLLKSNDKKKIAQLDKAMDQFSKQLKKLKLENSVTTFTTFDIGRVTTVDNHGLNHGWGGHAFVMGGAVKAGIHGTMPKIELNSEDMLPNTALIPTISSDQYLATMVDWLCDGKVNLDEIFPNLKNFEHKTLNFMA